MINMSISNFGSVLKLNHLTRLRSLTSSALIKRNEHFYSYRKKNDQEIVSPKRLTKANIHNFMGIFDTILSDCDGVYWTCNNLHYYNGVSDTIDLLRQIGNKILFVSNNSLWDRRSYIEKFRRNSRVDVDENDMFVVNFATAIYAKEILGAKKCYMLGTQGMLNELQSLGIETIGYGPDLDEPSFYPEKILKMNVEDNVDAVIVGYDEHFHHNKMIKAGSYLRNENCHFLATNDKEMRVTVGETHLQPVTGAFVAAMRATSGREPIVVGKPHTHMMDCILKQHPNINLERTIMVGDNLKTDVGFAKNIGVKSLLVLSGSASLKDVFDLEDQKQYDLLPDYYTDNICDLLKLL